MARVNFTAPRVQGFQCPEGKTQAFLWDSVVRGLGLRVTAAGSRAYVFQSEFQGRTLRVTIGGPDVWSISNAQEKARELQRQIDEGRDPREVKAEITAADLAKRRVEAAEVLTVAEVWAVYLAEGKPKRKAAWKPRYRADLLKATAAGGEPKKRGAGKTKPGHLAALMPLRLASIDQDVIRDWYKSEARRAPVQAARSVAMFSGFLSWCATRKEYRDLVDRYAARGSDLQDVLPASVERTDALQADQLAAWFAGTDKLRSRAARAYLQALVLTGARREEMAALRWDDVDFRWNKLTIADKVGDRRVIPLTPYLSSLLSALPRVTDKAGDLIPYVFASTGSASGRIAEPRAPHADVLADAGIPHVSIHGLRRTYALMGEAAGAPAGAIAQIMGHRPSAIAERYKPRPIDVLQEYATRIEAFVLGRAGIAFEPSQVQAGGLRLVHGA